MSPHPRLACRAVSWQTPDGRPVLSDVELELPPVRTGLVGRNGSGKSTLLRLLAGALRPTEGTVERVGRLAWLPQTVPLPETATVADVLGVADKLRALRRLDAGDGDPDLLEVIGDDWTVETRCRRWLDELGLAQLHLDRTVATLSGGERARTALAARLVEGPDWLLLDEPGNHLDLPARERLVAVLSAWSGGLVVCSHDRDLLGAMTETVEVSGGDAQRYALGFTDFEAHRAAERALAERAAERAATELTQARRQARQVIERQQKRSAQGRRQRSTGSQPKMVLNKWKAQSERSTARLGERHASRVAEAEAALAHAEDQLAHDTTVRLDLPHTEVPARTTVVEAEGLTVDVGDGALRIGPVDLTLEGPVRIGILGANGAGKSSLLRVLSGAHPPAAGTRRGAPLRWGSLDQHATFLDSADSVLGNLQRLRPALPHAQARWWLDRFGFTRFEVDKPVAVLSGGERMRAALACLLAGQSPPQVMVLDEPTNNLDLDTTRAVAGALAAYRGALLVVTHDRHFLSDLGVERSLHLTRTGAHTAVVLR